ncbi:DUF427 domain-containing protein [Nitratireductor thuwali]|uniref:DUF427 domain-containing protein n=1 Tax=Nitratireductor thuwali TaxID=2267699 RepID=A0ABY5MP14_9HYPH|nr:hypothetical protein NTH_03304 [Nitratireductor thuwali]
MIKRTDRPSPGFARNPDKKITVEPFAGSVTVRVADVAVAETIRAKLLKEDGYPPVLYIPFEDIGFANLEPTDTKTHCPYKGDASYWRLAMPGEPGEDLMWAYEAPYDEMAEIKDHGAFYEDRVTIETKKD